MHRLHSRRQCLHALCTAAVATAVALTASHASASPGATAVAPGTLWIDVRTPAEYASGHLPGAINIPVNEIGQRIAAHAPDKNTPIALYCRSGSRSGMALQTLLHMGYTRVSNEGSYAELKRRGVKP